MDTVTGWLNENDVTLGWALSLVLACLFTWFVARRFDRKRTFDLHQIADVPVLSSDVSERAADLTVTYDNRALSAPRIIEFALRNSGKLRVERADLGGKPIEVSIEGAVIESFRMIDESGAPQVTASIEDNVLNLDVDWLKPGALVVYRLLLNGTSGALRVDTIADVHRPPRVLKSAQATPQSSLRSRITLSAFLLSFIAVLFISAFVPSSTLSATIYAIVIFLTVSLMILTSMVDAIEYWVEWYWQKKKRSSRRAPA